MAAVKVFTFGYWGWGSETAALVRGIDAVESARGFAPPLFVDIRKSRSVRSKGFNGRAFERRVGPDRYVWLASLGNDSIVTGQRGIRIHDPSAAEVLLDHVLEASRRRQRVIFFCACEAPIDCHRKVVGDLLLEAARKRPLPLALDEWPGGEPEAIRITVPRLVLRTVERGRKSIPLQRKADLAKFSGLPWGSVVKLAAGGESTWVVSGPTRAFAGRWFLPVSDDGPQGSLAVARAAGRAFRENRGYGRRSATARPKRR